MSDPFPPTATGLYAQQRFAPGTLVAGRFRIESVVGVGGMGVVYRATDVALDVVVALKVLRPELATRADAFERFRQELLTARQVSSPRVVRIHDLAQHEGQWLISMDYVDGEGLDRKLDRDGALDAESAVRIARQLAEGLAAAHARGVIHRDLKPANVLIDRNGDVLLSDFGVARSLASNGLTQSGAVVGTPDYLSPEQARGEPVDARSDLYALGLILYEMLTGTTPFQGGTVSEILAQRMLRTPPPVSKLKPDTPAWLVRLVDRLLRPQPAHRLHSAEDVIRAIDHRSVPRDFHFGRRTGWGLAAVLLLAVAGVGLWQWSQRSRVPVGVAAVAPLHRLFVLPIEAPADAVAPARAAALTEQWRDALAAVPGLVVVDGERSHLALRQLDPSGTLRIDEATLRRTAGADRVLRLRLQPSGNRWLASATLRDERGRHEAQGNGATPLAAVAVLAAQPQLAQMLGIAPGALTLSLPSEQALDAYGNGLLARHRDAPAEALPPLRAATAAAPDYIAAWLALSEAAQAVGEQDVTLDAIEHAQRAAHSAPVSLRRRIVAERAMLEGDAPSAAGEWRAVLAATPDDTYAELGLARALGSGGDFSGAIARLQTLTARDANDPRAWFELGKYAILQGEARRAVDEYLVRALVLYKRSGSRYGEAETVNALGIGYSRLGQIDDAEEQYRKAVELRRAVGNRRGLATSLRNLGSVLSQRGRFDEAAGYLGQARDLNTALGDRGGLAAVENELGLLAEERGRYPDALAAFRRSLQIRQEIGDAPGTAAALNDIGFALFQLGSYDDAQAYLVQSANAYAELGDETGRIRTRQNLGLLAIARGQWSQARTSLEQSLAAAERQQMIEEAAVSHRNLAELELWQGHLDAALAHAGQAETLFRERDDPRGHADAGLLRVQALLAAHADVAARQALDALAAPIEQASAEQRGIAALLEAELARRAGNRSEQNRALTQAGKFAQASGVKQLQLQVALATDRDDPSLQATTAQLGHTALRLSWLQASMRRSLTANNAATAVQLYRDAQPLLRRGDYLGAFQLHELGARALRQQGDTSAADTATDNASAALRALRARVPAELRADFDRTTAATTEQRKR